MDLDDKKIKEISETFNKVGVTSRELGENLVKTFGPVAESIQEYRNSLIEKSTSIK